MSESDSSSGSDSETPRSSNPYHMGIADAPKTELCRLSPMKQLTLDTSVPDWLIAFPQLLTVFEELNIDCYRGRKSLAEACEERGLNPQATMTYVQSVLLRSQSGEFL